MEAAARPSRDRDRRPRVARGGRRHRRVGVVPATEPRLRVDDDERHAPSPRPPRSRATPPSPRRRPSRSPRSHPRPRRHPRRRPERPGSRRRLRAGELRSRTRVPPRPVPDARARRPRRRQGRAGRRTHRVGQDPGGRVRDRQGPRRRRQGLLHHTAEGALQPEVRRPRARARQRRGRAAHRRQRGERRRADRGDDHRGAAQHDLRGIARARRPALRRARRGALPPGPLPGPGLGGGDRAPPARGDAGVPLGHGVERRGGGGVDRDRPRQHRRDHRGAPAGHARAPLPGGGAGHRRAPPAPHVPRRARRRAAPQPGGGPARRQQRP